MAKGTFPQPSNRCRCFACRHNPRLESFRLPFFTADLDIAKGPFMCDSLAESPFPFKRTGQSSAYFGQQGEHCGRLRTHRGELCWKVTSAASSGASASDEMVSFPEIPFLSESTSSCQKFVPEYGGRHKLVGQATISHGYTPYNT